MDFEEYLIDAELHIATLGRDDRHSNAHSHPYEPTSYSVLNRLAESGLITAEDRLIDYGSGKGRVPIYLSDRIGCESVGVESVEEFYEASLRNLKAYEADGGISGKARFIYAKAQDYEVSDSVSVVFFFNPFSESIMRPVMNRILESYDRCPRNIRMFFYYPADSYIAYLSGIDEVMFADEIDCTDLFKENDPRNRIMIFEIG